jgi:hypothetical protein
MDRVIDGRHQRSRQTYFNSGFLSCSHLSHLLLESSHTFDFVCDFTHRPGRMPDHLIEFLTRLLKVVFVMRYMRYARAHTSL